MLSFMVCRVDLGSVYDVRYFQVFPRRDSCCGMRTYDWKFYVGNSRDWNYNYLCPNTPDSVLPATGISTTVPCTARGRYVTIVRAFNATDPSNYLSVCGRLRKLFTASVDSANIYVVQNCKCLQICCPTSRRRATGIRLLPSGGKC
jgi:hypothetical protein